jgi:hypothetical protein
MATLLKVLNNLADIKSAGVLHFASELRGCCFAGLQGRNGGVRQRIRHGRAHLLRRPTAPTQSWRDLRRGSNQRVTQLTREMSAAAFLRFFASWAVCGCAALAFGRWRRCHLSIIPDVIGVYGCNSPKRDEKNSIMSEAQG